MKRLILIALAVLMLSSCGTSITTIYVDYSKYSNQNFLVTPNPYYGEYESLGEIYISYPACNVDLQHENYAYQQNIETPSINKIDTSEYKRVIYIRNGGKNVDTVLVKKNEEIHFNFDSYSPKTISIKYTPQSILDDIVKKAKSKGADALTNFKFTVMYKGDNIASYNVEGFCIKRIL